MTDSYEDAVKAADAALEYAGSLPPGRNRSAAIRNAGRLRNVADRLRRMPSYNLELATVIIPIDDELLSEVPTGETNAVTARALWQRVLWSPVSVRSSLRRLHAANLIECKNANVRGVRTNFYFRRQPRGP